VVPGIEGLPGQPEKGRDAVRHGRATNSSRQAWVEAHPYLEPLARFETVVADSAARTSLPEIDATPRESAATDHSAGIPLLRGRSARVQLAAAAEVLAQLAAQVAGSLLPPDMVVPCRQLEEVLIRPQESLRAVEWLVNGSAGEPVATDPGLLRLLGWAAVRRVVPRASGNSEMLRDVTDWGRAQCPTCGSLPGMAQLVRESGTSVRWLACGCCRTRWRYRRIGCPFCGTVAPEHLAILELEDEERLRIDVCGQCKGYLKTYTGEEDEDLFLSDWPTLHLDIIARERGFERVGASLYEIPGIEEMKDP